MALTDEMRRLITLLENGQDDDEDEPSFSRVWQQKQYHDIVKDIRAQQLGEITNVNLDFREEFQIVDFIYDSPSVPFNGLKVHRLHVRLFSGYLQKMTKLWIFFAKLPESTQTTNPALARWLVSTTHQPFNAESFGKTIIDANVDKTSASANLKGTSLYEILIKNDAVLKYHQIMDELIVPRLYQPASPLKTSLII